MPADLLTEDEKRKFKKTEFFSFDFGMHQVRILTPHAKLHHMHFLFQKYPIKCLGKEECPICETNQRLIVEYPDAFRKQSNYVQRQRRHYLNVLDRTVAKVCPSCGSEIKGDITGNFSGMCQCGSVVQGVKEAPLNKVKVMSVSEKAMVEMVTYENTLKDSEGEPIGWTNYDFAFLVTKANNKKNISPQPLASENDDVSSLYNEDDLYDLEEALMILYPNEIKALLSGVSLSDIFKARSGSLTEVEVDTSTVNNEEIQAQVERIFSE